MSELAIIVPVLERPQNVRPLLESIVRATSDAHVVFVADPDDSAEIAEIKVWQGCLEAMYGDLTISLLTDPGSYAEKINLAIQVCDEPLIFLGADDLEFHPGWLEAAKWQMFDGTIQVVGVNDMLPRRRHHATHFLLTRLYALQPAAGGDSGPLFTGYKHNFCDDELIATAKHRGMYAYAEDAHVRHLHPQGRTAPDDPTYQKGRSSFSADKVIFEQRVPLWT